MNRFLLLFLPLFLSAQSSNDIAIRSLQDRRTSHIDSLTVILRSDEPRERELALLALANIQDTASLEQVVPLLNDPEPAVRAMAAFSTGMIGKPKGTNALFRRLAVERETKVIAALFNAIGMTGTPEDLGRIISQTENYRTEWKPFIAQSVYRFANRRIKDPASTKYAVTLLDDPSSILNAAYALMRINDTVIIRNNAERLLRLLNNTSPLVRMWGSTIIGSLDEAAAIRRLKAAAKNDKDWRVRVNALRALRLKPSASRELIGLLSDPNEHVALSAADAYEVFTSAAERPMDSLSLTSALRSPKVVPSVKDALRRIIAKRLGERALPLLGEWKTEQPYSSAQRIRAYGDTRSIKALASVKEALRTSSHSLVVIASLEAYQTIAKNAGEDVQKDFLKSAALLFQKNDAGISTASAAVFQDTAFPAGIRSIFRSALVSAYMGMRAPADLEPMVELLNVFTQIGDTTVLPAVMKGMREKDKVIREAAEKAYTAIAGDADQEQDALPAEPVQPFYTIADLNKIILYRGAEIITSKGTMRITFDTEAAPFTVLNFILLTEKKFYDGLSFHRVVSNFVVQGGDPLGNGSGGPDYSIRTEVHPSTLYRTGAVGMASSGKDTEGSQWFITHCPTPHLDYRYTIFAYTRDQSVVDTIMIGDRIERINLVR